MVIVKEGPLSTLHYSFVTTDNLGCHSLPSPPPVLYEYGQGAAYCQRAV